MILLNREILLSKFKNISLPSNFKLAYFFFKDVSLGAIRISIDAIFGHNKTKINNVENFDSAIEYIRQEFKEAWEQGKEKERFSHQKIALDEKTVAHRLSISSGKRDFYYKVRGQIRDISLEILQPIKSNNKVIIYHPGSNNPSIIDHYKINSEDIEKDPIFKIIQAELENGYTIIEPRYNSGKLVSDNDLTKRPKYISFDDIKILTWDEHADSIIGLSFLYHHILDRKIEEIILIGASYGGGLTLAALNTFAQVRDLFEIKIDRVICYAGMYDVGENTYLSKQYLGRLHIMLDNLYQLKKYGGEAMKMFAKYFILDKDTNLLFKNSPAKILSMYKNTDFINDIGSIELWVARKDEVVNVHNTYHAYQLLSKSYFKEKVHLKITDWNSHDPRDDV